MTPSGFFERIRSAVCEKAVAFWREDTSPKKRRTDSGEEALLSAEISATRSKVVFCLFFIGLVAVLGKAFWLQCGISTAFLQKQGEARYARTLPVPAQRGQIFDRNGVVLASTIPARSVWAEPEEALKLTAAQFDQLGALLGESGAEIRGRIEARKNKSFVYIDRQIEVEKGEAVRALQLPGIHVNNEVRRNYPDGPISAHVVGFTDSDNNGREGVELANNEILSGKQGSRRVIRDRLGRIVEDVWVKEGEVGTDVVRSIDSRLQFIAHKALQSAVERHQAKAGAVVVVDVRTGEILAMSNWPTYDPNARRFVRMENIRNRVSPHFIFNVLNREINSHSNGYSENMRQLVKLMRRNLELTEHLCVTLDEELDFVHTYIDLERKSMGDTFALSLHVDKTIDLTREILPSMMIQIPVENAIKHALREKQGKKNRSASGKHFPVSETSIFPWKAPSIILISLRYAVFWSNGIPAKHLPIWHLPICGYPMAFSVLREK